MGLFSKTPKVELLPLGHKVELGTRFWKVFESKVYECHVARLSISRSDELFLSQNPSSNYDETKYLIHTICDKHVGWFHEDEVFKIIKFKKKKELYESDN